MVSSIRSGKHGKVSTQKAIIPEMEILDNQGKDKKETIIKNEEDKSSSSPEKSTTEEARKKLSTEIDNLVKVVTPL
jgi:hypothetical protein